MQEILVLVGCGSNKKKTGKEYPWRIYTSDYYDKKMTLAMLIGDPAILSAEYGFLPITKRIGYYDKDMSDMEKNERERWALEISNNIPENYDTVVILAGKNYRYPLTDFLSENGFEVVNPFESDDMKGIGDQISWLKETARKLMDDKSFKVEDLIENCK